MRLIVLPALFLGLLATAPAQAPFYPTTPTWQSSSLGKYGTGLGSCDLDQDGWTDIIVANGNDMKRQRLEVYYNHQGSFNQTPDWESTDIDYMGHLAVGDIDGDGWMDVAVSVFLGTNRFTTPGHVKVYRNNGKGRLLKTPAWRTQDSFFSFGCALGDADGDGDLDLLVATGEGYKNPPDMNRLYQNNNGVLSPTPTWKSTVNDHSMCALFADVDNDGDLDLAFAGWKSPSTVYLNRGGGVFPPTPDWQNTDNSTSLMVVAGDLDGDRLPELVFADNSQLGGFGRFKFYRNSPTGLAKTATWVSTAIKYGSCVALADLNLDGRLDLAGGGWWDKARIYLNQGGTFPQTQSWSSTTNSVLEKLLFRDTRRDGLYLHQETFGGDGKRKVFTLRRIPVESIYRVQVDGIIVPANKWCADQDTGWLALATAPTKNLRVFTVASYKPALVASNWDPSIGNYIFRRAREITFDLAHVFDWYDPRMGMWPFVGVARNLQATSFTGKLEARYFGPTGNLLKTIATPLSLTAKGKSLFWNWFPPDWAVTPGLYGVQLRVVAGNTVRHLQEFPVEIKESKPIFK